MKLWLLLRNDQYGYDVCNGFVVRATSAHEARRMASKERGDEGAETWLDPLASSCKELKPTGNPGIVLRDFNAG